METKPVIPIFFSVNDAYAPYLAVALNSIRNNASPHYDYRIHILSDDLSRKNRKKLGRFSGGNFSVSFIPLTRRLRRYGVAPRLKKHRFSAFASLTIYFRLFIPELFPQYDKAIYLDSDIVVPGDISRLWETPLGDSLVGACADYSIRPIPQFLRYIEEYVGVDPRTYVNSGVLLMNLDRLRKEDMAGRFLSWMEKYNFATVAPDQDYLNALCAGSILYLDPSWDTMPSECAPRIDCPQIIHFNLATKPWMNESVQYGEVFWEYAVTSGYEAEIRARRQAFLSNPSARGQYEEGIAGLVRLATELTEARNSFRSIIDTRREFRLCCC